MSQNEPFIQLLRTPVGFAPPQVCPDRRASQSGTAAPGWVPPKAESIFENQFSTFVERKRGRACHNEIAVAYWAKALPVGTGKVVQANRDKAMQKELGRYLRYGIGSRRTGKEGTLLITN